MGRKPVDKVIEHRIVFGSKERMQLDSLITSLNIKNIATPTVSILNDVTGMIALIGYGSRTIIMTNMGMS
jgi:hypothetical protein